METLEDRHMLSVSFESPLVNTYVPDSTGVVVNPNLVDHRLLLSGDFNNDGKQDLLTIQGDRIHTYLNSGSTTNAFSSEGVSTSTGLNTIVQAGVGKVTGGSNLDLLTATMSNNVLSISVVPGSENGTFYPAQTTTSTWSGIESFLRDYLPASTNIPPNALFDTLLGDIALVENSQGRIDVICTVTYSIVMADFITPVTSGTLNLVFTNDGTGKFTPPPPKTVLKAGTTEIPSPVIAAGDLTGKTGSKLPDYVTTNPTNSRVLDIYLNNGTKLTTQEFAGKLIGEVVVAQCHSSVNKMEIIVGLSDASGHYLCVVTVTGTTLTYSDHYKVDIVPTHITTGNFNNDTTNRIDIFISNGSVHQTLLGQANTSAGKFVKQNAVIANADFLAVHTADFDNDGNIDTLVVGKRFAWLISGNTTKIVVDFAALGISPRDSNCIAFGDFNGDGKMDFAVLSHLGNEVFVFTNQTTSPATPTFTRTSTLNVSSGKQLLVANFDNANGDDIVVYGYDTSSPGDTKPSLQTFLSTASGGFGTVKTTNLPTMTGTTKPYDLLAVGEVTNDGYIDIVGIWNGNIGTTPAKQSYYHVLENNKTGVFITTRSVVSLGSKTTTFPTAVAIGDMNGDGKKDLVLLDADSKSVWIMPQTTATGGGVFYTSGTNFKTSTVTGLNVENAAFSHLALGDFHAKGVLDVLAGVFGTGVTQFRVFENDGTGTLKTDIYLTDAITSASGFNGATASSLMFHVGKLDDNGTADVVIVGGNTVKRFINTDKSGSEIGTVMLVFRDYNSNAELTYIDEWSTFYVEIWANTGTAAAGIKNFETVITFDTRFFEVRFNEVTFGTNISGNFTKGTGQITLTGTVAGTQGNNKDVLVGSVAFRPSSDTRSVALDFQYGPKPINNGFAVQKSMVTTTANTTGQSRVEVPKQISLFPVIYDNNGDGKIDASDLLRFLNVYRMNVTASGAPNYIHFCNVVSSGASAQTIDAADLLRFLNNFRKTKKDFRDNPTSPANKLNYDTSFTNQIIPATGVLQTSIASNLFDDGEVYEEIFNVSSTSELLIRQTLTDQSTENQALLAYIASQETKKDDYGFAIANPASETERLLAEGKL